MTSNSSDAPFLDHLEELRLRLIYSVIGICICFIFTSIFSKVLLTWIMSPVLAVLPNSQQMLHFTSLMEPFLAYLKVAILGAVFLSMPHTIFQAWQFIVPGLYQKERKLAFPIIFGSSICFIGGGLFGYFVVLPFGFKFFLSFASDNLMPMLTLGQYLSLCIRLLLAFGIVFETPMIQIVLSVTGLVNPHVYFQHWRYAIIGIAAISAILTPADIGTMILMAIPLMVMYFVSALIAKILWRD